MKRIAPRALVALIAAGTFGSVTAHATTVPVYLTPATPSHAVTPLLSVGDRVPVTGDPALEYQMVGIPDGLGAVENADGTTSVYVSHEFGNTVLSEPVVGDALNRGAIVSRYELAADGMVLSGARAYDTVFVEDTPVGPAADVTNTTPGFGRFGTGSVADARHGFDRPIYLTNEESDGAATFGGLGGESVAIFDGEIHTLPALGRFSKEQTVVQPIGGDQTVIMTLEDGPSSPDSQLYMYVGTKDRSPDATVLERNGLVGGTLYTFVSVVPGKHDEGTFTDGSIIGRWVEIPDADALSDIQLEEATDAAGANAFIRIEDGAFNPLDPHEFWFVTTGGNAAFKNTLGRLYQLRLNPVDVTRPAMLRIAYNADTIVSEGGDIALSPDNVDTDGATLMIQEDGTSQSRAAMTSKGRDAGIWAIDISSPASPLRGDPATAEMIASLAPPGRDGVAVTAGVWESSGIIDVAGSFGEGAWLVDVQAHPPTAAPAPYTIEDGQLLLMTRV